MSHNSPLSDFERVWPVSEPIRVMAALLTTWDFIAYSTLCDHLHHTHILAQVSGRTPLQASAFFSLALKPNEAQQIAELLPKLPDKTRNYFTSTWHRYSTHMQTDVLKNVSLVYTALLNDRDVCNQVKLIYPDPLNDEEITRLRDSGTSMHEILSPN